MDYKKILKHIGIAIGIVVLLAFITLQILRVYTHHGESVEVPSLKGLSVAEASILLEEQDLFYEIVDSIYKLDLPPGTIIEQTPVVVEKIKKNREIYLVINYYEKPTVSLPDVRDLSFRNAKATLEAMGLQVKNIEYVPSEFKNLVKDVKMNGRILTPGSRIQVESSITLVVGGTPSSTEIAVPSLRGLKYDEAVFKAHTDSLSIRIAQFDGAPHTKADSAQYFVYKQSPIKGSPAYIGSAISIWLSKDKSLLNTPEEEFDVTTDSIKKSKGKDIEEFF